MHLFYSYFMKHEVMYKGVTYKRNRHFPFTLFFLPIFLVVLASLIYIANNKNIFPPTPNQYSLENQKYRVPVGRTQVGIGGGPQKITVTPTPTPHK